MLKANVQLNAAKIAGMSTAGMNISAIARDTGLTRVTVRKWIQRYREHQNNGLVDRRVNNFSYRITTPEEDMRLEEEVAENPLRSIKASAQNVNLADVSATVLKGRLNERGLHCHKATKKIALTDENKAFRLDYANCFLNLALEEWNQIIWSDERYESKQTNKQINK